MLDTDTCAFVLRGPSPGLAANLQRVPLQQQVMSVVTLAELLHGVRISSKRNANRSAVDALLGHLRVLDWQPAAAVHYADIRADLRRAGTMIGANDLMIAAHARSLEAAIVTNNVRDFGRVKGLRVENWLA
ncbi:MAG: type II toxin-antitoxin system VapC family toxin [Proteobacteria bacterium]|jgi:tRNA(fMet)-specific endonuclease VapC|nr:type II toxin-antitoxin system VapC family toxin [Pseudomonadota bacterium]